MQDIIKVIRQWTIVWKSAITLPVRESGTTSMIIYSLTTALPRTAQKDQYLEFSICLYSFNERNWKFGKIYIFYQFLKFQWEELFFWHITLIKPFILLGRYKKLYSLCTFNINTFLKFLHQSNTVHYTINTTGN